MELQPLLRPRSLGPGHLALILQISLCLFRRTAFPPLVFEANVVAAVLLDGLEDSA
jgi:hypothetical protein